MIITTLSIILFTVFTILGGFHFYWFLGGIWGIEKVIPSKDNVAIVLTIPKFATLIVGLVLVLFGLMYLIKSGLINVSIPIWLTNYGYWVVPSIFILRAIGEFNYVGFFKKIINTKFAKADSKLFSPLCLVIGIIGILIQLMTK
jgi:hypothetical protein